MAKDLRKPSLAVQAYERYADPVGKLPPAEDRDCPSQCVMLKPVTMEEMLILPRPASPETAEEATTPEHSEDECSPNKAYMIRNRSFPGSAHIAGENALLLMSSIY